MFVRPIASFERSRVERLLCRRCSGTIDGEAQLEDLHSMRYSSARIAPCGLPADYASGLHMCCGTVRTLAHGTSPPS